jgi:hypothetical protein
MAGWIAGAVRTADNYFSRVDTEEYVNAVKILWLRLPRAGYSACDPL